MNTGVIHGAKGIDSASGVVLTNANSEYEIYQKILLLLVKIMKRSPTTTLETYQYDLAFQTSKSLIPVSVTDRYQLIKVKPMSMKRGPSRIRDNLIRRSA